MILLITFLLVCALVFVTYKAFVEGWELTCVLCGAGAILLFTIWVAFALTFMQWNTGSKMYTGYIYSVEQEFNKAIGHIRYSQNAGSDSQPSFCVDVSRREELEQYVGKDVKVQVTVPAGFGWSITDCINQAQVKVMEEE